MSLGVSMERAECLYISVGQRVKGRYELDG